MKTILSLLFTFFILNCGFSQNQEELERRKAKLQQEIRDKEKMLKEVKTKEKSVTKLLVLQKEKIGLKEKLITTTEKQKNVLDANIHVNQTHIDHLKYELGELKEDYAAMIVKSYKSRSSQSRLMFLLSSENFAQAYKRFQYMKQYSSYRKMQGEEIKAKTNKLNGYVVDLGEKKSEKEKIISEQEKQKLDLEKEKKEQEKIANSLKKNKQQIASEIKKKQQENRKIDAQIQRMIREAIAAANRKAAAARAKTNPKTTAEDTRRIEESAKIVLTPEGKIISDNFKANKGNLPWPVEKGAIRQGFGNLPHHDYPEVKVHNSGIDISTEQGSSARAVFKGEVTEVQKIGSKFLVYVRHGDFFTIYQNLSSVSVSEGDNVSAKQTIGKVKTDSDGNTILKFTITQNTTPVNPSQWISR